MTPTKQKKKKIKATKRKKIKKAEAAPEKTAFKKQLVEIKWLIKGQKHILKAGMEEELYAYYRYNGH